MAAELTNTAKYAIMTENIKMYLQLKCNFNSKYKCEHKMKNVVKKKLQLYLQLLQKMPLKLEL